MTNIPFPLRSNPGPVTFMGETRLINCFAEQIGQENRSPVSFVSIPGQTVFSTPTDVPTRGMIEVQQLGIAYSLHGATLYKIVADGTATALTGVIPGSAPAIMEQGPEHLMQSVVTITIASPAVVSWTNHRLAAGTTIQFSSDGDLPTGIAEGTTYFILATGLTANSFEISLTNGGSAVNTTGFQTGTHTAIRTVATYQVAIATDLAAFVVEDDHISLVELPDVPNSVFYLAGRFLYPTQSGRVYFSAINDATSVGSLDYFTAEARPDGLVRGIADRGEAWLFGTETTQIYVDSSDADDPYVPLGGSFIQKGCASRDSVVSFDNAPHWLTNEGNIVRGAGSEATIISTPSVDRAIATVTDKTTIRAYVDTAKGHSFLILTCDSWTWAFDASTRLWHERKSYGRDDWRAWPYVTAFGNRLVGDKASGTIRQLVETAYDENGDPIRCELILPDIPGRIQFGRLELDVATGVGLGVGSTANGYDPQIMVSWSDDGGYTWSNERTGSVGRQGHYDKIVAFNRLGMARTIRGRRFKIAMSEPTIKAFMLGDIQAKAAA